MASMTYADLQVIGYLGRQMLVDPRTSAALQLELLLQGWWQFYILSLNGRAFQ